MAEVNSTCKCKTCGIEFKAEQRAGRPAVNCPACKRQKAHSNLSAGVRNCVTCGKEFSAKANQKHCSDVCRNGTKMTREQYRESVKAKPDSRCEFCGSEYKSYLGGKSIAMGHKSRFCSRECMAKHREENAKPKFSNVFLLVCQVCQRSFYSNNCLRRHCSDACRIATNRKSARESNLRLSGVDKSARKCKCCGSVFKPAYGVKKRDFCSSSCAKRFFSRLRCKTHRRRARSYGVKYEHVNPISVFDRDGWRCKLCGVKTPKELRGTIDQRAPELDHIVPLSKGGAHSYENTQCLCRKCNGAKGNKPLGQLLLIG